MIWIIKLLKTLTPDFFLVEYLYLFNFKTFNIVFDSYICLGVK